MYWLLSALSGIASLAALVCFIMVVIQMFQHNMTGLGIVCIVLFLCIGIGGIIALIVGWQNADRWRIRNLMQIYTVSIIAAYVLSGAAWLIAPKVYVIAG
ncbi:MAG TPA: hypothetical protein VH120_13500 [Gemmataceae bacterium]|jgi:hypothetical protein|nr:hypothetical protein [Gemmataceae bacterium]